MLARFKPKIEILPKPQQEIWPQLAPASQLSFVLYGGTAVAFHLGHRQSIDFDFFRSEPLNKKELEASFAFLRDAKTIQEDENTLVVIVQMPSGPVKVSFFGNIKIGRINDPRKRRSDSTWRAMVRNYCEQRFRPCLSAANPLHNLSKIGAERWERWAQRPKCLALIGSVSRLPA